MSVQVEPDKPWQAVLAEQIAQHSRLFFRLAYGVLRDGHAAEDVCQQAFLKAWQGRDQIREAATLKTWLARVVVNESLQVARRRKIEHKAKHHCAQRSESQTGPGEQVLLKAQVEEALMSLPEPTRLVVVLRMMDGLSGNEVSELLGCSASEVSRRLHEGMNRLRELLMDVRVRSHGT